MKLITRTLLTALTLLVVAAYVPGISITGLYPALIAAVILGFLNVFVRPVLVILTFPITIVTVGLFLLVINASLFWFAASFIDGFLVTGFGPALVGSLIVTLVSTFANRYVLDTN
jgi:putative membrane protein